VKRKRKGRGNAAPIYLVVSILKGQGRCLKCYHAKGIQGGGVHCYRIKVRVWEEKEIGVSIVKEQGEGLTGWQALGDGREGQILDLRTQRRKRK